MPVLPTVAPTLTTNLHDSPMSSTVEDHFARRDSRVVEYHSAIPEEDESVGTASEPAEPVTPSSDTAPNHHLFHHDGTLDPESKNMPTRAVPPSAATTTISTPADQPSLASVTASKSNNNAPAAPAQTTSERHGLGKRVGSFVRSKLQRNSSHKDVTQSQSQPTVLPNEKLLVKTGVDGPAEVSSPAVNIPRYKRLSSFSLSARSTPRSSHGNSPPSPSSPTSTISRDTEAAHGNSTLHRHKHSSSSTAISAMARSGPGITWAAGPKDGKTSRFGRRRSVSSETVSKPPSDDKTIGLIDTFSKPAAQGVGLKARRLSLNLPDEFVVDSCELDKEYKSSSLMPGKRGKVLGKGATAEVRIMARKGTFGHEELVAVKEFRLRESDEDEEEYTEKIKSEFSIAKSLHHPNIVETVRLCTNRGRWNHVMEFCTHGELFTLVERKLFSAGQEGFYSVQDRLCFFKQLLRGVDYLHCHGIAHRDIKLENLLLSKDGHLKISDFGVAEVFCGEHPGMRTAGGECGKNMGEVRFSKPGVCGSLPYIAPEVLEKKGDYDPRPLDIWSCAIVFLTMTFGGCPWQAAKPEYEYYARYKRGWDQWLPNHPDGKISDGVDGHPKCGKLFSLVNPPPVKRLLLRMLHPLADKRITIREVITSNCIKSIDCCCPESFEDPTSYIDTSKAISKNSSKVKMTKQFLHHHIPPAPEKKINRLLTHRFDMGE